MTENTTKSFLGDDVYVEIERGKIKLTTGDGLETTNTIYLESWVAVNLERYLSDLPEKDFDADFWRVKR
jgi:hypothetical protein